MGTIQIREGIPQLARFLFLREAWRRVVGPAGGDWVEQIRKLPSDGPGGHVGNALDRLLRTGAAQSDITVVVRVMQWWLLAGLCQLLDEPPALEAEVADIAWRLVLLDEHGEPTAPIEGLIESLLETEPSGREMRPRDKPDRHGPAG